MAPSLARLTCMCGRSINDHVDLQFAPSPPTRGTVAVRPWSKPGAGNRVCGQRTAAGGAGLGTWIRLMANSGCVRQHRRLSPDRAPRAAFDLPPGREGNMSHRTLKTLRKPLAACMLVALVA